MPTSPMTPGVSWLRITISAPASGASIGMPSSSTRRGPLCSKIVPSTQRSPSLVCSFSDSRLVKRRVAGAARLDDVDAALGGERAGR